MSELTRPVIAAMWFWHDEYASSGLSAVAFYQQLTMSQKRLMDDMVKEIVEAAP